jgi:hypothetical protein
MRCWLVMPMECTGDKGRACSGGWHAASDASGCCAHAVFIHKSSSFSVMPEVLVLGCLQQCPALRPDPSHCLAAPAMPDRGAESHRQHGRISQCPQSR